MKSIKLFLGVICLLSLAAAINADVVTYDFDDGTVQGWSNQGDEDYISWNTDENTNSSRTVARSGAYMALEEDYSSRDASDAIVKVFSSPEFLISSTSSVEIWTLGGTGGIDVPTWTNISDLPGLCESEGFMGAALRRVSDGEYLLFSRRSASGQSNRDVNWLPVGFSAEEIATAVSADSATETYVVDIIDTYTGGWGWIGIDDATFTDVEVVGTKPVATYPQPERRMVDVPMTTSLLDWDVFNAASPTYDVYFGVDPEGVQWLESTAGLAVSECSISTTLASDTTYYWRVDVHEAGDPNTYTGELWYFATEKELPQITAEPKNAYAFVGESVQFEVSASDPLEGSLSYQWYEGVSPDKSNAIDGAVSEVLTISSVTTEDFSTSFYCEITNAQGLSDSASAVVIKKHMLAYWPMDSLSDPNSMVEGTPDIKTNGEPVLVDGVVNGAFQFDGEDDFLYVPESGTYFNQMNVSCSVACWIKSSQMDRWAPFVSKHGESNQGWQLRQYTENGTATFTTRGTGNEDGTSTGTLINDGQWHYVVGTFDGRHKNIYVDGIEMYSLEVTSSIEPSANAVAIATEIVDTDHSYNDMFHGVIDEVKLYNYAMDKYEVAQIYADISGNSVCPEYSASDLDKDCDVDLEDFAILAESWLKVNTVSPQE